MAKEYADDDGKLRIFNTTLDEMRANRRATGETFPSKFTKKTLRQSSIDNLQPTTGKRVDFSDEKIGPKFKSDAKKESKKEMPTGDIGSVDRTDDVIGPDMSKITKADEEKEPAVEKEPAAKKEPVAEKELDLQEKARRSMGFKKGGTVKSSSASKRADGCAVRGKTKGKIC